MAAPGVLGTRKTVKLAGGAATQAIESAVAGKMIVVDAFCVSPGAAGTADFQGTSGTSLTGTLTLGTTGAISLSSTQGNSPLFWTAIGEGLQVVTTAAAAGFVTYRIVPV